MGPSLQRLEVAYNEPHDRLVLILYTQDFNEYLFWITRRATPLLWNILTQLLNADQKTGQQRIQEKEHWAEQIEKEKEQKQPLAEQLSTRVGKRPLGNDPLLLARISGKTMPNASFLLRLEDLDGRWIEFGGDSTILLALCELIQQSVQKADWGLSLEL